MSSLDDRTIALIKGMLARGDRQSDIAAWFLTNNGRTAEIHHSMTKPYPYLTGRSKRENALTTRAREIIPAPEEELPPAGAPSLSIYDTWVAGRELWKARVALEHTKEKIDGALSAIVRIETKMRS